MEKTMRRLRALVALVSLAAWPAAADDRWEIANGGGSTDDTIPTNNGLTHGTTQLHDLQGSVDTDIGFVAQRAFRSYEARIVDTQHCWNSLGCDAFERIDAGGVVVQPGIPFDGATLNGITLRWETDAAPAQFTWVRTRGTVSHGGFDSQYEIQFYDTTYLVPRWNNGGTQTTVFLIQAAQARSVTGSIHFFNAGGTLLATAPLSVPAAGLQVVGTSSISALAGQSGSAVITHSGGYGALAGKAVALEPGTGFSFDTVISPIELPR
jgi:hypothetical protein